MQLPWSLVRPVVLEPVPRELPLPGELPRHEADEELPAEEEDDDEALTDDDGAPDE